MRQSLMAQLIYHAFYDFATGSEEEDDYTCIIPVHKHCRLYRMSKWIS